MVGTIIFIAISLGVLAWLTTFFTIVNQKTAEVIEVFGKFYCVKNSGLNVKPPFPIGKVASTVSLQIREISADVGVKSSDMAFLNVPVKVQFRVLEDKIKEAHYELDNPESQLKSYILNMVRAKASSLSMDQLYSSKNEFEDDVKIELNERFSPFGYFIENVLVDDPQPSIEVVAAFNKVIASKRLRDASINEAEALRIKLVGEARAEKESLTLKGEGFKEFRAKIAEGNTEAMALMLGTHEFKEYETEEEVEEIVDGVDEAGIPTKTTQLVKKKVIKKELVELKDPKKSSLTEKDILDFFAGIDQREAIRDASRGEGNTVVVPSGSSKDIDYGQIAAMVKALNK